MQKEIPVVLALGALAAAGCNGGRSQVVEVTVEVPIEVTRIVEVPVEVTKIIELEPDLLHLAFDGETCTYQGPTDLTAGPVVFIFRNDSERTAAANLLRHRSDEPIQDAIDYIGNEPSIKPRPGWQIDLEAWQEIAAGQSYRWDGVLEPGIHNVICASIQPFGVWFGAGLTVED